MEIDENMAELLNEVRSQGGPSNVEVISTDDAEHIRSALGEALKIQHGLPDVAIERMSIGSLAAPFATGISDDEDAADLAETLAQHPEVGSGETAEEQTDEADADDADPIESLSATEKADVEDKLRRAEIMADRTPEYSESLRSEAAEIVGVDDLDALDDLDLD